VRKHLKPARNMAIMTRMLQINLSTSERKSNLEARNHLTKKNEN